MELGLTGRVALITGGSAGLGRAAATTLAREGARVVIVARGAERLESTARELRDLAGDAAVLAIPADVSKVDDIAAVVHRVVEGFGGIDVLVNNAGAFAGGPFLEVDDATWLADFDLKLFAAARCARACIPSMQTRGGGRIVNVLAISGRQPGAGTMPTSISRAAGLAFTKALSKEFAADQILVNAVLIGMVKSNQWERRWEASGSTETLEEMYEKAGAQVPVGRVADAEEFADLVAFLVSERARYITGAAINFDGGEAVVP